MRGAALDERSLSEQWRLGIRAAPRRSAEQLQRHGTPAPGEASHSTRARARRWPRLSARAVVSATRQGPAGPAQQRSAAADRPPTCASRCVDIRYQISDIGSQIEPVSKSAIQLDIRYQISNIKTQSQPPPGCYVAPTAQLASFTPTRYRIRDQISDGPDIR